MKVNDLRSSLKIASGGENLDIDVVMPVDVRTFVPPELHFLKVRSVEWRNGRIVIKTEVSRNKEIKP